MKADNLLILASQVEEMRKAFELFIAEQNKHTLKPSEMLAVFKRMGLDKEFTSCTELLTYMVNELGDIDMHFEKFMRLTNDYYS